MKGQDPVRNWTRFGPPALNSRSQTQRTGTVYLRMVQAALVAYLRAHFLANSRSYTPDSQQSLKQTHHVKIYQQKNINKCVRKSHNSRKSRNWRRIRLGPYGIVKLNSTSN
jgi:hypothetical protein